MGVGEFAVCDSIVTASSLRVKNLCCMVSADLFRTGLGTCVSPFRPREEICYLAVWKGKFVLTRTKAATWLSNTMVNEILGDSG